MNWELLIAAVLAIGAGVAGFFLGRRSPLLPTDDSLIKARKALANNREQTARKEATEQQAADVDATNRKVHNADNPIFDPDREPNYPEWIRRAGPASVADAGGSNPTDTGSEGD